MVLSREVPFRGGQEVFRRKGETGDGPRHSRTGSTRREVTRLFGGQETGMGTLCDERRTRGYFGKG